MFIGSVSYLNGVSLLGLAVMVGLAVLMSSDRGSIRWRLVVMGVGLQLVLGAIFFNSQRWTFPREYQSHIEIASAIDEGSLQAKHLQMDLIFGGRYSNVEELREAITNDQLNATNFEPVSAARYPNGIVFFAVESFFGTIQKSVDAGTEFLFQVNPDAQNSANATHPRAIMTTFAFGVLPTVIFFASLMSVLYYLRVMQWVVRGMAWIMQKTLGVSGAEALAAAANVLVGHTEAPLVVKPYVATMTRSEMNAMMVSGFATISGSLMAIFATIGVSAGHLLTASIISAPAALVLAKILQPETETPESVDAVEARMDVGASNVIEAAANGASEGMKLAINIAAMLIGFLALIMFIDILLQAVGGIVGAELSLQRIFGAVMWPLAWVMGIENSDCTIAGDLLGRKMVINEFVAYLGLIDSSADSLSERSRVILTYALCGFSNFGAIAIQLGGIGPLAPNRKSDIAQLGLRAMFGGMLACCMTGCVAGLLYGML
ncbi:MAG: NupC/NupG family nucleoside CNT transporter [Rubripirellula sp.]